MPALPRSTTDRLCTSLPQILAASSPSARCSSIPPTDVCQSSAPNLPVCLPPRQNLLPTLKPAIDQGGGDEAIPCADENPHDKMNRSKREVAPPPAPSSSPPPPPPPNGSIAAPGCFDSSVASLQTANAMALPPGAQAAWWNGPMPQTNSFGPASPDCGIGLHPPGGFLSYFSGMGQQPFMPPHVSVPPPWSPTAPATNSGTKHATKSKRKAIVNIDDGDDVRTAKRLSWEPVEDKRLVSAWLYHSNDPINGNCKKNESYWADVVELYNSPTPVNRKREIKHLKDRWQGIKRKVAFFCACWKKATSIYTSGYSDDQLRDYALQFYLDDFPKEGPFTLEHCWKLLRDEPKWHAVLEDIDKSNKRSLDDGDTVRQEDIGEKERPMGRNEAKKLRSGKGKYKVDDPSFHEDMKKYMDIQAAASKRHEEFLETQQRISDAKVEAARLRKEAVLLESYQKLLTMDTTHMTDDMKAEHVAGLKILKDKLLGNAN